MRDIYSKIKVDYSFYKESKEKQKEILDKELRIYLTNKIIELYFNKVETTYLEELTTKELIIIFLSQIPNNDYSQNLQHVIHAILNFAGNMQNYSVVWREESDSELIQKPKIIFDEEDKWLELVTNINTPYEVIFDITYNTFIEEFMKKSKHKVRKKDN